MRSQRSQRRQKLVLVAQVGSRYHGNAEGAVVLPFSIGEVMIGSD
jgi:hypothetical protein